MPPVMSPAVPRVIACVVFFALLALSFALSARAEPLALDPDGYVRALTAPPPPERRVVPHGSLGGGLIEFLWRGDEGPRGQARRAPQPLGARVPAYGAAHAEIDPQYLPQSVAYAGREKPGTIVIDTPQHFLYLVEPGGTARRYGIGVGRPGFTWAGVKEISAKRAWPDWRPPAEMLQRRPDLPSFMAGGPENPLGARAMYLGSSLYRIHGSNEPWTIGTEVSSGCIRMRNEDVIDLYDRVKVGARVIVI
jgi:lipoprotein-anchoring transpeptidase ErfK/SrfK